jgi:hypothetical protein
MDREEVLRLSALTEKRVRELKQRALKQLKEKKGMPVRPEDGKTKVSMAALNRMVRDILPDEKEIEKDTLENLAEIEQEINKFNKDPKVGELINLYYEKSLPEILGVNRDENSHSNFLAWILNPSESHKLRDFALKKFMGNMANSKLLKTGALPPDIRGMLSGGAYTVRDTAITREKKLGPAGRVDILVETAVRPDSPKGEETECKIRIIIENKVESAEGQNQTQRYYNHYNNHKDSYFNLFAYLTPLSSIRLEELEESECGCKEFVQLNYQLIVNTILEPALEMNIPEHVKSKITEYIRSLSKPSFNDEETDNQREIIMAVGKKEKELLLHFLENHKRLITSAYRALSEDESLDEDDRKHAAAVVDQIREVGTQNHMVSPEVQRFIRRVFNHYAKNELSEEPTDQDKDRRESEVKEEYKGTLGLSTIRLTRGKGQGVVFSWLDGQGGLDYGYISGDYRGVVPNDPSPSQKSSFKKYGNQQRTVGYWKEHFEELIEALEAGILLDRKQRETGTR